MREQKWEIWLKNRGILNKEFNRYLKQETIREGATPIEADGHLSKAKRNLHFARTILDDLKDFYEWSIVAYYYSVYQAALALCATKGYKTKSHIATISIRQEPPVIDRWHDRVSMQRVSAAQLASYQARHISVFECIL